MRVKPLATTPTWKREPLSLMVAGATGKEGATEGEAMASDELFDLAPT